MDQVNQFSACGIQCTPLTPAIGAELSNVDLAGPPSDAAVAFIRQALLDWKVIFFRDQQLDTEKLVAVAGRFGKLSLHPFLIGKPDHPEVLAISRNRERRGGENLWHSDVTFIPTPPLGSLLYSHEIPPIGGDTLFADMSAAYDGLSDEVKHKIEGRQAIHDFRAHRVLMRKAGVAEDKIARYEAQFPPTAHPVVRTHPETRRKLINVSVAFTEYIIDMDRSESDALLQHLYAQASIPEYQVRFKWTKNCLTFWDNRATQHYAVSDYWPAVRTMERVTIEGDIPC
jgi:taurine dioxygenase